MKIVPVNTEQIAELSAFASAIVKEHFDPIIGPEQNDYMIALFQSEDSIREQFQQGYRYYFVQDGEKKAGFLSVRITENDLYLSKFYVEKSCRGKGIASKMMEFVKVQAVVSERNRIRLNVNRDNQTTISVYSHLGFVVDHYEKNDIGNGFFMDDAVMIYTIKPEEILITDGSQYIEEVKDLIKEYTAFLGRDLGFQNLEAELADLNGKYGGEEGCLLVGIDHTNQVVGCVAFHRHNKKRCEMKRLFVKAEYRSLGIGDRLVEAIIDEAKNQGYEEMVLDTIIPLQAAIHLYQKHGFNECGAYYDNPMADVIYMHKYLNA